MIKDGRIQQAISIVENASAEKDDRVFRSIARCRWVSLGKKEEKSLFRLLRGFSFKSERSCS